MAPLFFKTMGKIVGNIIFYITLVIGTYLVMTHCLHYRILNEGEVVFSSETVMTIDSLLALDPVIEVDTVYVDTGSLVTVYRDSPVIEIIDSTSYIIRDSLRTDHFVAWHDLSFSSGIITSNHWRYIELGTMNIVTTLTKTAPYPVPYAVQSPIRGFYLGLSGSVSGVGTGFGFSADYARNKFLYGVYVHREFGFDKYVVGVGARVSYKIF